MNKVIGLHVNFFKKLGGSTLGFISEHLGKAKGFIYLFIYFSHKFDFYYGVSMGIRRG
jgi:hypothetical protein